MTDSEVSGSPDETENSIRFALALSGEAHRVAAVSVKPSDKQPLHDGDATFTSLTALGNGYLGGLTTTYVTWLP